MIYHLYWSRCQNCKQVHKWPSYELFGIMLMANPQDMRDQRRLETADDHQVLENTTFRYVARLAKQYKQEILEKSPELEIGSCWLTPGKHVFSMICDAVNGVRYHFGSPSDLPVRCPYCDDSRIPNWGPTEKVAYEIVDLEIPLITHTHFDALPEHEKKALVYAETRRGLEYWHEVRTVHDPSRPEETILERLARDKDTNYPREHLPMPLMDFNVTVDPPNVPECMYLEDPNYFRVELSTRMAPDRVHGMIEQTVKSYIRVDRSSE